MHQENKEGIHLPLKEQTKLVDEISKASFETLRNKIETGEWSLQTRFITKTPNNRTILHFIVMGKENENKLRFLEWILRYKASEKDMNAQTDNGYTPLALAADYGNIKSMKLLIAYGADTELKTDSGKTVLKIWEGMPYLSNADSISRLIKEQKKGERPVKPIFLTEQEAGLAPLAKENQSENASSNVLNALRSKLRETVAFWKHAANKPTEEKAKLLKKEKEEEKEKTN